MNPEVPGQVMAATRHSRQALFSRIFVLYHRQEGLNFSVRDGRVYCMKAQM